MDRWKLTLGLSGAAVAAALLAPRLLPALGLGTPVAPEPEPATEVAALELHVASEPVVEEPAPPPRTIDLVVALDTSGSMGALIDSTRARLWDIVNEIDQRDPDAILRVGLVTYGTPAYGEANDYVKVQMPLTEDLDAVYAKAWELGTNGGDEFVGAVIDHALTDMAWAPSDNPDNRRLLFVAGNETAGLGPVHFRDAARRAVGQRVIVNTLFAGTRSAGEALRWAEVASAGNGRFMAIDAEISAVAVATPYDAQLEQLNSRLNGTYVSYDRAGAAKVKQIVDNDNSASSLGVGALASRIGTKGSGKHKVAEWDLVEGLENGSVSLSDVDATQLPPELQQLSEAELSTAIEKKRAARRDAKTEIQRIQAERARYIREQSQNAAGAGLDEAMAEAFAEQL
ncbi:MAG: VWA domain-containing protein [Alphaproteobacteria bacterium]|nr:VWA domain-containing protein [Alphaproteobacteria bacterium]